MSPELDINDVAKTIKISVTRWRFQCHSISLAIVKAGVVKGRVARGVCEGVGSQHSWIVEGEDCYDPTATIYDPTAWCYWNASPFIWEGTLQDGLHFPHGGMGSLWTHLRPTHWGGDTVHLTPSQPLSDEARGFLEVIGELDLKGWNTLAHAPIHGWPSRELIGAMYDTKEIRAFIPIDIVGMLTDRNPGGLYW